MASKFRLLVVVAAIVALGATATALGSRSSAKADRLKIALSNSFIGNKWRIEMENLFKAACKMPPYNEEVDCSVYNSGNDVSKQTQQLSNLISQRVDAILVNAASPTGLNGIIAQACARKILVVSYDNVVTAPCALKVNGSQYVYGQQNAHWLPFPQVNEKTVKLGETVFTNLPDSFFDAFTDSGPNAIVKICVQAALSGQACPGSLKVNVPWTYHPAGAR